MDRGDKDDFLSGNDSPSAAEFQWVGEERTENGKIFPLIGKKDLFYLLYKKLMLLSVTMQAK
jgi:hypothetical protein